MKPAIKKISIILLLVLSQTIVAYTPSSNSIYGSVYTRGVILDESGNPTYVAYNTDGTDSDTMRLVVNTERLRTAHVLATNQANAIVQHYQDVITDYPDAEVLTKSEYEALTTPPNKPALVSYNNFVVVRGEAQRQLMVNGSQLILQESLIDPQQQYSGTSMLISSAGEVIETSEYNIGLEASFLKDNESGKAVYKVGSFGSSYWRNNDQSLVSPLVGLPVSTGEWITGTRRTVTDERGRYSMRYYMFCPGFQHEWTIPVNVELKYSRFNPRGQVYAPYFFTSYKYDYCSGLSANLAGATSLTGQMAYLNVMTTELFMAQPIIHRDVPIDIVILDGAASFGNVVLGSETKYDGSKASLKREALVSEDFDNDGTLDKIETGKYVTTTDDDGNTTKSFQIVPISESPNFQAIWLSSEHDLNNLDVTVTLPSYTRLLDWSDDFQHRALLTEIKKEDLQNTDIYLIRESDGTLITERRGIKDDEYGVVGNLSTWDGEFKYTMQIVNKYESRNRYGYTSYLGFRRYGANREKGFDAWQAAGNMDPKFYERDADHLRIGELVRIVAINRATGYMGTVHTRVKAAGDEGISQLLSFYIPKINMLPPNLKIWAKRTNEIKQGVTKGDTKEQTVGNEGAGLSDDKTVVISTEWLDIDGSPLPAALDDYGFTGRLAKVIGLGENVRLQVKGANFGSDSYLSNFSIKPGRQTQLVRLSEQILGEEHLYVHVNGEPLKRRSDLSTPVANEAFGSGNSESANFEAGNGEGILKYRPSYFVPVKVPVFDEKTTKKSIEAWNIAKETDSSLEKPEPYYRWLYRPEFQVSIYDLEVDKINRTQSDGQVADISSIETPVIGSTDSMLDLLYNLTESSSSALEAYSYGDAESTNESDKTRELVFGIGEEEIRATIGVDQTIQFTNLDYLANLEPEDFLSIKLYSNNDSNNILWEWAFEYLAVDTLQDIDEQIDDEGIIHVSADNPNLDLQALLFGYADRDPEKKKEISLTWELTGDGTITTPHQVNSTDGVFNTKLLMPTTAGSTATIKAILNGSSGAGEVIFGTVVVDPGVPANISTTQSGNVGASETKNMMIDILVKDSKGNLVADGTSVILSIDGDAKQEYIESSTVNGAVKTTIKGGEFASTSNTISINSGGANKIIPFSVSPLNLALIDFNSNPDEGSISTLILEATDSDGVPLSGTEIIVSSNYGMVKEDNLITGSDGRVTAHLINPPVPKEAKLTARVGYSGILQQDYVVGDPVNSKSSIDAKRALLVGDKATAGTLVHHRYDDTDIDMVYPIEANIELHGTANSNKTITLGDFSNPNIAPVTAYYMSRMEEGGVVPDETAQNHAQAKYVNVIQDHPMGAGHSYNFVKGENLQVDGLVQVTHASLLPFANTGNSQISLSVQFPINHITVDLLTFDGNAQRLSLNEDNTISYHIKTEDGDFSVTSESLGVEQLHDIKVKYEDETLVLEINTRQYTAFASGSISYEQSHSLTTFNDGNVITSNIILNTENSEIVSTDISKINQANQTGFRLDFKTSNSQNSQMFSFDSGARSLNINENNQVVYQINTSSGSYNITSDPLTDNVWHKVAGRYFNGKLELEVDGQLKQTIATGNITYTSDDQLRIGSDFTGNLNSLHFYDWTAQPLVAFLDGSQQKTFNLDSTGKQSIKVKSLGNMNSVSSSELSMISVSIHDGHSRQFVNLLSSALFKEVGGNYIDHIAKDAPTINIAAINNFNEKNNYSEAILNALISPAHAYNVYDFAEDAWEGINWVVPLEDIGIFTKQIYYLSTSDPRYDSMELALATVGVITIIPSPPTKALKPVVKTLRKTLRSLNKANPKFVKAFASVVGKAVNKGWKTNSVKPVLQLLPFLFITAEMATDEQNRQAFLVLVKSVQSDDDLLAWIEYLALPTDGWDGDVPPDVNVSSINLEKQNSLLESIAMGALNFVVNDAHAAKVKGIRVPVVKLRKVLNELKNTDPKDTINSIKTMTVMAKQVTSKAARKLLHTRQLARFGAAGLGANVLKKLVRKGKNMRTHAILVIAAIAYLESRKDCDDSAVPINGNCIKHTAQIYSESEDGDDINKLNTIYQKAFFGKTFSTTEYVVAPAEEGQMFHLVYWAYRHALHEASPSGFPQVLNVEQTKGEAYKPPIFTSSADSKAKPKYWHELDLVLASDSGAATPYTGVELKSWAKGPLKDRVAKWKGAKGGSNSHKQFYLDRVALKDGNVMNDLQWKLQTFDFKTGGAAKDSPLQKDLQKGVWNPMGATPLPRNPALKSLGYENNASDAVKKGKQQAKQYIKLFNALNEIKANAQDILEGEIGQAIEEYTLEK